MGPCDAALALIGQVFGSGIRNLDMDTRMGIDVMGAESGALSSIWITDEQTRIYLDKHGRGGLINYCRNH